MNCSASTSDSGEYISSDEITVFLDSEHEETELLKEVPVFYLQHKMCCKCCPVQQNRNAHTWWVWGLLGSDGAEKIERKSSSRTRWCELRIRVARSSYWLGVLSSRATGMRLTCLLLAHYNNQGTSLTFLAQNKYPFDKRYYWTLSVGTFHCINNFTDIHSTVFLCLQYSDPTLHEPQASYHSCGTRLLPKSAVGLWIFCSLWWKHVWLRKHSAEKIVWINMLCYITQAASTGL